LGNTLNIIGCGRVGRTLARLWTDARTLTVADVLNRSPGSAADAVDFIGGGHAVDTLAQMQPAGTWLIGTGDGEIRESSERLAASGRLRRGDVVFHCSGALGSGELAAAANCGALVASAHPVASFADPREMLPRFAGSACCIEGEGAARERLDALFRAIGAKVIAIDGASKLLYHAGAVFASNYLVALMETALRCYAESGIPRETALALMQPLAMGSAANVFSLGTAAALTGPIARGDFDLVRAQYAALAAWDPATAELYKSLGVAAAQLAGRKPEF
jgi:predicted short-subunit dehydrogenase-like oxidoreductase (DUF2520 family)